MTFPYRHNPCRTDPGLSFVKLLADSYGELGVSSSMSAATTSMDAWLYPGILGIPALATGCGNLEDAHTINEYIVLRDIAMEAAVLLRFIEKWCGMK